MSVNSISQEKMYHIALSAADGARYCLMPGDPGRVKAIAACLEDARFVAQNREFTTWTGTLSGEKILVTSTGIGGPSAAIAMEELSRIGVDTFIRIGTAGGIRQDVLAGDLVVASAAVRMDGTSREYAPLEFPAVADFGLVQALCMGADSLGFRYHYGVVQSKDSFYGQHSPEKSPVSYELLQKWDSWKRLGVLASEMETATLYTVAAALGVRCASILCILWNQERKAFGLEEPDRLETSHGIDAVVKALQAVIEEDRRHPFFPGYGIQ